MVNNMTIGIMCFIVCIIDWIIFGATWTTILLAFASGGNIGHALNGLGSQNTGDTK